MHFATWYNKHKNNWWALPLILPALMLPLAVWFNANTLMEGGRVFLIYMPLGLMSAFVLVFGWAALPGIVLALLIRYLPMKGELVTMLAVAHFLIPVSLSFAAYRVFVPRRHAVAFGVIALTLQRMFWLVLVSSTLFLFIYQMGLFFGWYDPFLSMVSENPLHPRTLINFQAVLVGTLTGMPFFYFIIRIIRNPHFVFSFWSRMRGQAQNGVTKTEVTLWIALVALLINLLLLPLGDSTSIFRTDYTLTLILPVMLWGAMRFGFLFITNIWTIILIILCSGFNNYLPPDMGFQLHLAIASSCYAIFSITIFMMAAVTTRQRFLHAKARRAAFTDPIIQMPNLRALNRDIGRHPWSALAFLRIPELELLGRNYGVLLRIQYKQQIAEYLRKILIADEKVYHLSGHDLAVRLNYESHETKIEAIDRRIKQFRFMWDGMPLQPQVGISYCYVRHPISHLYLLLGELSTMAELSLTTYHPENLQQQGSNQVQNAVKSKVAMMNRLQIALDGGNFLLMAQRIEGMRGDSYHEILLRMQGDNGELFTPDSFLPVAHEFGLSSRIDHWVLESTLQFMDKGRERLPGCRFAINLTPASVSRMQFPAEVKILLEKYNVEPWQLVFEVTESNSLTNLEQANMTLTALQRMGCRVAIDDFGTGYASYARLKNISADILKIDGSFIRNLLTSSLDYQIVESICQLARMKKMQVVAEYVENEALKEAVQRLGIDYMQGYLIGYPQPLESLLSTIES
ncbi:sensor domain-containing phosphodiesterase [Enterobacteriaceae bacterium H20N1]|uniref:Sensor domain-containing phosphodiesterase n=1 Tax=Dryocola boscaweniae TaxID=2925397 RepID=A0A9X2W751_9ENTR|nr:EAL domain-containing protein [Dryocola boscaweniae]MCT4701457.1 sensor domain-containing phosphodiesterase [Dryocola boscaweniae]MCT4718632.1 sensor domain-containing phosphodiesterase [Dryocola boscaweniae]